LEGGEKDEEEVSEPIVVAFVLLLAGSVFGYTYEGELDPGEFRDWPIINQKMVSSLTIKVLIQNPDPQAEVQKVEIYVFTSTNKIMAYRYFKDNEVYLYKLDIDIDRYKRKHLSEEETRKCMKCHKQIKWRKI